MHEHSQAGADRTTSKIRVFIADGESVVRRGIALLLQEDGGMEVIGEAADNRKAVESVRQLRPDVVLVDADKPGLSCLETTRRLSEATPAASVLILTNNDREDWVSHALLSGASGYVLKNASVEELVEAIRLVRSGETFIYPCVATKSTGSYPRRPRGRQGTDRYARLSAREREVLPLLADGCTDHEIASTIHVSPYTVRTY